MENYGAYVAVDSEPTTNELKEAFSLLAEQAIYIVQGLCGQEKPVVFDFYVKPEMPNDPLTKWDVGFRMKI